MSVAPPAVSVENGTSSAQKTVGLFVPSGAQNVAACFDAQVVLRPSAARASSLDAVAGWAKSAVEAARFATRHRLPLLQIENGPLRSIRPEVAPFSFVVDDLGIYWDARRESRLERILNGGDERSPLLDDSDWLDRARSAIEAMAEAGVSQYGDASMEPPVLDGGRQVLVVDQEVGDRSVAGGLAQPQDFERMLDAALAEHPDAEILICRDTSSARDGHLEQARGRPRVRCLPDCIDPSALLKGVSHVYVVTSQVGLSARMIGKTVTCLGAPFYAGWGLTDDRRAAPRRTRRLSLQQLYLGFYLLYGRYVDPDTGNRCELERVIEHFALQRRCFAVNDGDLFCFRFHFWKRNWVRAYLRAPHNRIHFPRSVDHAKRLGFGPGSRVVTWAQRETPDVRDLAERHGAEIWRMEDGFLRSVGLGSDLAAPASLVVDRKGMYYDPRTPSELELLLQQGSFDESTLERARALRERIISAKLSKYNVGVPLSVALPAGRKIVLAPGQV